MHVDLPEKRYYGIGEVAKAFGVNTSLIRFWEKEFDVLQPKKKRQGQPKVHPKGYPQPTTHLSLGKRARFYFGRCQNPFKGRKAEGTFQF